jgi:tetratricopeptide (TPR) repeat protein
MMPTDEAMHRATQLHNEGQIEQAEALLNSILKTNPSQAYALHLLGIIAYQMNKINSAVQLIEQAINTNPHVALFHSNLGEMHRQLNALDLSIQHGKHAVTLDPHSATALSNLGIAYYDARDYKQAKECHQQALAIDPKLSCSLNNMGSIYNAEDQAKQAMEFYQAAVAASPHFVDPLNNLGALFLQQQEFRQAFHYLQQALILAPDFADAQCNFGLALLGLDQSDHALPHFEKALQLKPDYAEAYYGIAKVQLQHHHFIEAEHSIRNALMIKPQEVDFYQLLAEIYQERGQYAQALVYLDQILAMDAPNVPAYLSKGTVLMEMGELAQAEEHFLKITADPKNDNRVLAHYCRVQLRKVKTNHSSLSDLLSLVTHHAHTVSPNKLAYAYFALGKCYDDLEEWDKAFEYFSLGCHLKRTSITYNSAEQVQFTNKLTHCFTQQMIDHLRSFANPSALPIFILGMPRSGTTLVEQILSSHPQVHGAGELKYLNHLIQWPVKNQHTTVHYPENILHLSPTICQAIADQYLSYLNDFCPDSLRITDKMPNNFIAIGLIHALFPNAKIIHVQRNPLDTCLSCYTKLFTQGQLYSYDLTELGHYYHSYELIMNHWRHVLPNNAWLDIQYETLVSHLDEEAPRLIEFCDLPWNPACLTFYQSKRQVRTASFAQVRQPVYTSSVARWRRYEQQLKPLIKALNRR